MLVHNSDSEKWKVTLIDTGLNTATGGRIKRIAKYIGDETFMMTYGDGVANVNIRELVDHHKKSHGIVTLTAAKIKQRFGVLSIDEDSIITSFREKLDSDAERVNAGFMVLEPTVFEYIDGDDMPFEKEPLEKLVRERKLAAYKFDGFWQPMDTMRDKKLLENMWDTDKAPWKVWN